MFALWPRYRTFDLGDIAEASHGEAVVLAIEGAGDGAAHRGLADTGRPHQAKDVALRAATQPPHSYELEHTLFHIIQSIVVLVQHLGPCTGGVSELAPESA